MSMGNKPKNGSETERIEEISRNVLKNIASSRGQEGKEPNRFNQVIKFITSNWPIFLSGGSIISALAGLLIFDISPFQPLQEIAYKQAEYQRKEQQEELKKALVARHLQLGNLFLNDRHVDDAIIEFKAALELDPLNNEAQDGLFKSKFFEPIAARDYDPDIMEKKLKVLLERNPNDAHAFLFFGEIYHLIDGEKAIEYYKKAMKRDPALTAAASFGIGVIYTLQNKFDEAQKMYERACRLSPWNQQYLDNLSYQYYLNKEYDKAISHADSIIRLNGTYLAAYYTISKAYREKGKWDLAIFYQTQLVKLLQDTSVTFQKYNRDPWFFPIDEGNGFFPVYLTDVESKICYAYHDLALTCCLFQDVESARYIMEQAPPIKYDAAVSIRRLMNFDKTRLLEANGLLRDKIGDFEAAFFKEDRRLISLNDASGWFVQFAALRSPDSAEPFLRRLMENHQQLLNASNLDIKVANLGDAESLPYRICAGPYDDQRAAESVCSRLGEYGLDCYAIWYESPVAAKMTTASLE
jgi:tetratricopeptide (TPR) repeat protein